MKKHGFFREVAPKPLKTLPPNLTGPTPTSLKLPSRARCFNDAMSDSRFCRLFACTWHHWTPLPPLPCIFQCKETSRLAAYEATPKKKKENLCDKKCQFWWPTFAACHAFSTTSCFSSCVRSCCVCSTRACNSCCVTSQDATSIGPWVTWLRTSSSFPKKQRWNIWNIRPLQKQIGRCYMKSWGTSGVQPLICQLLPQNAPPTRSGWHAGLYLRGYNRGEMVSYVGWLHTGTTTMVRSRMYISTIQFAHMKKFIASWKTLQTFFKGSIFFVFSGRHWSQPSYNP